MAAAYLETPSRVWRRIEAVEGRDMPSLPSLPTFDDDDSTDHSLGNNSDILGGLDDKDELRGLAGELRASGGFDASGPAHTTAAASTIRPGSSINSTARLLNSLTGRSSLGNSNASKSGIGSLGGSGSSGRRSFGLGGVNVMRAW
ncbi:hypothetical protein ONZ45_g19381 [Pleurotus djamor]|nr:hypothetical protein ONZ45_g19381 [Pleurotus djamor]